MISFIQTKIDTHFHALKHVNFRIFWFGQLISLIGNWMQTIAMPWLAYSITKSPLLLGVVGALQFTPVLFLSLFVGVFIDRHEKKKIIMIAQTVMMVLSLALALLVFTGTVAYWHLLVIAFLQGCANAFEMPTRQSFIIEMVGRDDLMNAIGLNSAIFNLARILGPAVAGVLMTTIGTGYCFLFNAFSFIPLITGLYFIKPLFCSIKESQKNVFREIVDGFRYIASQKTLARTMVIVLIVGTFIMNFNVMVPVLAKTALHQGEAGFGFLMSCMGIGSLCGALIVAARSKRGPDTGLLFGAGAITAVLFIAIGLSRWYALTAVLLACAGFLTVMFMTTANSTIQLSATDDFRSRAVSVYFFINVGSTPVGNVLTGAVSNSFGINVCYIAVGAVVLVCLACFSAASGLFKK
ncbi:MAG: MFS transporter [Spirochaetes bacterium]|nr:MFS transporter [Spirochaetota bacterium]